MRYLVTGVKGQLGFDVVRELKKRGKLDILGTDKDDLDITDEAIVNSYLLDYKPDVVIHCAAYTNVNKAEDEEDIATAINTLGVKYLASACNQINAKLIYISTDYVFDGQKKSLYEVDDIPHPLNVYGKTKYLGELEARKCKKAFVVRTSWVFGINGNNFVKTMLKLADTNENVKVVGDQIGSPTYTVDLAHFLVDLAETDKYGIYHASNSGYCSWATFAEDIFKTARKKVNVQHVTSDEYPSKALRPLDSRLSKKRLPENGFSELPTYEDALKRYIIELGEEV